MIEWVFLIIAIHGTSATAYSVGFESGAVCAAYALGVLQRPEIRQSEIQVAKCVSLHTGRQVDFNKHGVL